MVRAEYESIDLVAKTIDFQEKLMRVVRRRGRLSVIQAYQIAEDFGISSSTAHKAILAVTESDQPLRIIRKDIDWIVPMSQDGSS